MYVCCACPTEVQVELESPFLPHDLTNHFAKQTKTRTSFAAAAAAKLHINKAAPSAFSTFSTMTFFIKDVLTGQAKKIPIQENNTFARRVGSDGMVASLMTKLYWRKHEMSDGAEWRAVDLSAEDEQNETIRHNLEKARLELKVLAVQARDPKIPDDMKSMWAWSHTAGPIPMLQILGSNNYPKKLTNPWAQDLTGPPVSVPARRLGIMSDFSDDLVREFYRKQCKDDPENESHYFDALRAIAQDRATEELSVLLAEEESKDKVGYQDTIRAYDLLGITPDVSDEFVTVYYETKLSDLPERKQELRHALETIAKFRKSAVLKHYVQHGRREHDIVMEDAPMELDMAYATLNITDRNAPDEVVVSVYDIAVGDAPAQMDEFTRALRAIGEARKSEAIVLYLANRGGVVDEALLAPLIPSVDLTCPVGLENIGNTCYLNSLLQYYFTIKPLRQAILVSVESGNIEVDVQANENGVTEKRVGGRAVSKKEIERAVRFVTQLSGLFKSMIASTESAITPERDVAYLALVSSRDEEDDEKVRKNSVGGELAPIMIGSDEARKGTPVDGDEGMVTPIVSEEPLEIGKEPAPGLDHSEAATKETTVAPLASEVPEAEAVDGEKLGVTNEDTRSESSHTVLGEDEVPGEEEKDFVMVEKPKENETNGVEATGEVPSSTEAEAPASPAQVNEEVPPAYEPGEIGPTIPVDFKRPLDLPPQFMGAEPPPDFKFDPQPPTLPARPTAHQRQSSVMFGRQQDVTECIDNVMFQIEAALKPASVDSDGEQVDIVKELFYGKTKQLLVDMDMEKSTGSIEERRAAKEERFAHLIVDVHKDGRDIYNALDSIFDAQSVDLDGKQIRRQITVSQLPPILQIQIQRVQFDRATGQVYKSNAYLKFGETLYMDRYLDTADENIQARREASWKWKAKLEKLEARKHELVQTETRPLPIYEALEKTRAYLETMRDKHGMDVDPFILRTLEDEAKRVKAELETIEERITELQSRVNQQFTDLRAHGYRLHSVFIHRGSAAFGHYWIYIYDFARGVWRKYNDQYVTEVGVEEVLRDTTGDTASPYLLTYVKEGTEGEVVEAVKREVPQ
ncbi:hypothetical protein G7K_2447-t1 [Saitoella complicata NRRL Y-17804]|uniref:ubiquitinyl hydrolase 1 n=1 Tax=Saitoella complicata (strain BCRC 22490 / CBS 7301 / JCM 7358 / NBRC 10748 / NRRL Y-17804) TaxID=698492 RepID=A0A0E9NEI6_SAICN|nr:hypothetical protein G7K_2447-t1 [Saitoella complicata NRRL Y-17804]